jgi:hypothetical protein
MNLVDEKMLILHKELIAMREEMEIFGKKAGVFDEKVIVFSEKEGIPHGNKERLSELAMTLDESIKSLQKKMERLHGNIGKYYNIRGTYS